MFNSSAIVAQYADLNQEILLPGLPAIDVTYKTKKANAKLLEAWRAAYNKEVEQVKELEAQYTGEAADEWIINYISYANARKFIATYEINRLSAVVR